MNDDVIKSIILGAPNFVGFIMLSLMLYRINSKLIDNWKDCETDNEKKKSSSEI